MCIINSFNVIIICVKIRAGIMSASVKSGSSLRRSGGCKNLSMPWEGGLAPDKLLRRVQIYAEVTPMEVD